MNGLEERWKAGVVKWIFRERGKEEEEGGRQQYEMGDLKEGKGGGRGGKGGCRTTICVSCPKISEGNAETDSTLSPTWYMFIYPPSSAQHSQTNGTMWKEPTYPLPSPPLVA